MIGRTKDNPLPLHDEDEVLANEFISFFIGKIEKIRDALDQYPLYEPAKCRAESFCSFQEIEESDVRKLVKMGKATTCSTDPIPSKLVKQHLDTLLPLLTRFVNLSLCSGSFADEWKTAVIKPLLKKKGLDRTLSNYRPVSNLSFTSKLVERACLSQIMPYVENNHLLPDYQSAYRKGFSTETALVKLQNDVLCNMEKQRVTALVCVDLSAAFDTVNHDILLDVLENKFGLSSTALTWFENYLRPRSAKVQIGEKYSKPIDLSFSVPQGSLCGPILYTVYASTLPDHIGHFNVSILGYADDHSIYDAFDANSRAEMCATIKNLELCLVQVNDWMNLNRLKMNTTKTEHNCRNVTLTLSQSVTMQFSVLSP